MKTSIIVTCGYIPKLGEREQKIEIERLKAFMSCLSSLADLDYSQGDEIVFSEFGMVGRLKNFIDSSKIKNFKYVFTQGRGFNQALAKNAGAEIASNDILCFINSDVILRKNIFSVLRKRFQNNERIFATAARHDVWLQQNDLTSFLQDINDGLNYKTARIPLDDAGWNHALGRPKEIIYSNIQVFLNKNYRVIHDFQQGYINYGELMAVKKEVWQKYPFDPEIIALVDSYFRDFIFAHMPDFSLDLIHDETSVFHLSGSDYMQQEQQGSNKHTRLIQDMRYAIDTYECMRHWAVLSYFPEFDDLIEKHKIPFKEIFDQYCTDFMWKYWKNKDIAIQKYGVKYG